MHILDLISAKQQGKTHSPLELNWLISHLDDLPDYQISAWLMAVCFRGMTDQETGDLTIAMANSGHRVDLSAISGIKVDKHSSGGVADTTSLVCLPLAAACGVPIAKLSGKGLGHTGGTADKLLCIPGFRMDFSDAWMATSVRNIGLALLTQNQNLTSADQKLYALRDVTSTVDSLPLIASSIMSKKLATGADAMVLDVKFGNGAFMKSAQDAEVLARLMVKIGRHAGRRTMALVTDMSQPLGSYIGNLLEVQEALSILSGNLQNTPLSTLSLQIAAYMLLLGGICKDVDEGLDCVKNAQLQGKGLQKLNELLQNQGAAADVLSWIPKQKAPFQKDILATQDGYIFSMDTKELGLASVHLGAGRLTKTDILDSLAGITLHHRVGEKVKKGQPLATLHSSSLQKIHDAQNQVAHAITLDHIAPPPTPLIYSIIQD